MISVQYIRVQYLDEAELSNERSAAKRGEGNTAFQKKKDTDALRNMKTISHLTLPEGGGLI